MYKKVYIVILSVIFLSFILTGCSNNIPGRIETSAANYSSVNKPIVTNAVLPQTLQGTKGTFYWLRNTDGTTSAERSYNLKKGESFQKIISICNMLDDPKTFKILLFIDFEQSDFFVDGKETREFTFDLEPGKSIQIPVKIKPLSEGLHDTFFIIAKQPNEQSLDVSYRTQTLGNHILSLRFNLLVENDNVKPFHMMSLEDCQQENTFSGVFINREADSLKGWLSEAVNSSSKIQYYFHIGTRNVKQKQKYALITLRDWKQTSMDDKGTMVYYFEMDKNQTALAPGILEVPDEKRVCNVTSLLVHNPFEAQSEKENTIDCSVRVGLDVQ